MDTIAEVVKGGNIDVGVWEMKGQVPYFAFLSFLVFSFVVAEEKAISAVEKVEALSVVIHSKDIGCSRVFFLHGRFNLSRENLLDFLFVALQFDYGKKVPIEPFEVLRAAFRPVVGVVLKPCGIVEDSPVEAKGCGGLVTFWEANFGSDVVLGV